MRRDLPAPALLAAIALALLLGPAEPARARGPGGDKAAVKRFKQAYIESVRVRDYIGAAKAVRELCEAGDAEAAATVYKAVFEGPETDYQVYDAAYAGLSAMTDPGARAEVVKRAEKGKGAGRLVALRALGAYVGDDAARAALLDAAGDKSETVASAALGSLRAHPGDRAGVDAVLAIMKKADGGRIAAEARSVLQAWTGAGGLWEAADWESWWTARREDFDFAKAREGGGGGEETVTPEEGRISTRPQSPVFGTVESKKVVFIVDISGSMSVKAARPDAPALTRLEYVKRELASVIETHLSDDAIFNIVIFDDAVSVWKNKLVRANDKTKKAALAFVQALEPKGGTNTLSALEAGFQAVGADTIVFLSDGSPTEGETTDITEILGRIRKMNVARNVRIDTIAFLSGKPDEVRAAKVVEFPEVAKELMRKLAEENAGTYRLID